ncbi:MAG: hypothetical protein WC767_00470 [Candidatus Paceibacterota bacterium]|jgi:hypothetical protein
MNKKTRIYILCMGILGILSLASDSVESFSHGVTDLFITGHSPIRIYIFLSWIILLLFLDSKAWKEGFEKQRAGLMVGSLAAVFAVGIFMQVWFDRAYDIETPELSLVSDGREMTGTAISHNHLSKSPVGSVVAFLSPDFESLDPGMGAGPFVPLYQKIAFDVALAVFIGSTLLYFIYYRRKGPGQGSAAFVIGFGLLTGLLIMRTVDGGLFAANSILSLGILLALAYSKDARSFLCSSLLALVAQLGWYLAFPDIVGPTMPDPLPYLLSAPIVWMIIVSLLSGAFAINPKTKKACLSAGAVILAILIPIYSVYMSRPDMTTDSAYVATYKANAAPGYKLIGSINSLMIYEYKGDEKKMSELASEQDTLAIFNPVSAPGKNCPLDQSPRVETFRILSREIVSSTEKAELGLDLAVREVQSPVEGMRAYRAVFASSSCTPRYLSVLQEMILSAGAQRFIISHRK